MHNSLKISILKQQQIEQGQHKIYQSEQNEHVQTLRSMY